METTLVLTCDVIEPTTGGPCETEKLTPFDSPAVLMAEIW